MGSVLWSGLFSRVGAEHRVNFIAPFPLRQKCPKNITMTVTLNAIHKNTFSGSLSPICLKIKHHLCRDGLACIFVSDNPLRAAFGNVLCGTPDFIAYLWVSGDLLSKVKSVRQP